MAPTPQSLWLPPPPSQKDTTATRKKNDFSLIGEELFKWKINLPWRGYQRCSREGRRKLFWGSFQEFAPEARGGVMWSQDENTGRKEAPGGAAGSLLGCASPCLQSGKSSKDRGQQPVEMSGHSQDRQAVSPAEGRGYPSLLTAAMFGDCTVWESRGNQRVNQSCFLFSRRF